MLSTLFGFGSQKSGTTVSSNLHSRSDSALSSAKMNEEFVGAIDCGTTSCRFFVFDKYGTILASAQKEFKQIFLQPGWQEQEPSEWFIAINECIEKAVSSFESKGFRRSSIKVVGITNQRETTVVWDKLTGKPLTNAIAWPDTRNTHTVRTLQHRAKDYPFKTTSSLTGEDALKEITGLPISTYFSGVKLRWMLDNVPEVQKASEEGRLLFGTVESYLVWQYTGGLDGGIHVTDYVNASRTLLLNMHTLEWDEQLIDFLEVRGAILPKLVSNSDIVGKFKSGILEGIPIAGLIGDQQSALVGNRCLEVGQAKNTYGTGCFMLYNTGPEPVKSTHGLLTTIAYHSKGKAVYALEGSMAVAGSSIQWARDNLNLVKEAKDIGPLAAKVEDTGGVYFVTGFSGLFAPYWDDTATGCVMGISTYTSKAHIARAILEATCWQTKAILESMEKDSGKALKKLKVDGGMTNSDECMQIQADTLGIEVKRPDMRESTALGCALLAGTAMGLFGWDVNDPETVAQVNKKGETVFVSKISAESRKQRYALWNRAIERSKGWYINN